jgi:hypothetical protein
MISGLKVNGCNWRTSLNEVSQAQKDKGCMFFLMHGKYVQKVNIYTKTSMVKYKVIYRTCLLQ